MVDPLGTASGVLALTIFAFNATVSLYQALNSFQNITKAIIDLKKELQDLEKVLTFLQQALSNNLDELLLLESVLSRCGQKCENFQTLVAECTQNSSASRTSLRDWAKLKFKQNEITELRDVLSRDKLTISVAVCGINLCRVTATADTLDEHQRIIVQGMYETKQHLQEINHKLQALSQRGASISDEDAAEWKRLHDQKVTAEKDLTAFVQALEKLREVQSDNLENIPMAQDTYQVVHKTLGMPSEKRITAEDLHEFQVKLTNTISDLKVYRQSIDKKLQTAGPMGAKVLVEEVNIKKTLQKEKEIDEDCLALYRQLSEQVDQKRTNILKDTLAARDAHQVVVSTVGDLISCTNVTAESGAKQWLGQMSDASLQLMCRAESTNHSTPAKVDQLHWSVLGKLWVFWVTTVLLTLAMLVPSISVLANRAEHILR